MNIHQRVASIFWLIIGVYVLIHAYGLGVGHFREPGPGFIFFWASLLLIILSVIDLARIFISKPETDKDKGDKPIWSGVRWGKVLFILIGLSIYICIFNFLGFIISTFLLMIFLFKAVETTKWWIAILSSLINIICSYGIFELWLKIPFPQGVLGF